MKPSSAFDRVHTLILPLAGLSLLVPSSLVAEVVNPVTLTPVPQTDPWLVGAMSWRSRPVPVISFEHILGDAQTAPPRAKIVIFYPLHGRPPWEFFAAFTAAEPQPRLINDPQSLAQAPSAPSPFIAMALAFEGRPVGIPDLNALFALFYPR